tara:strand:- start:2664 stop:3209 length:546 start_codon:yes stop_codon:yes gene_type:complete
MELNYYTLMIDWNKDGNFSPEFGDWDEAVVKQEQIDDYEDEAYKIVTSTEPITAQVFKDMPNPFEEETPKPSRKKTKIFAVSVWSEVERTVYVRANTAKQAENLIDECRYVEGENEFAETIMDEGGNIGHTTRMDGEHDDTYEVEEMKDGRLSEMSVLELSREMDNSVTTYYVKKEEDKSV